METLILIMKVMVETAIQTIGDVSFNLTAKTHTKDTQEYVHVHSQSQRTVTPLTLCTMCAYMYMYMHELVTDYKPQV